MIAFIFYTNAMGGTKKLSFSVELGIFFIWYMLREFGRDIILFIVEKSSQ